MQFIVLSHPDIKGVLPKSKSEEKMLLGCSAIRATCNIINSTTARHGEITRKKCAAQFPGEASVKFVTCPFPVPLNTSFQMFILVEAWTRNEAPACGLKEKVNSPGVIRAEPA